MSDLVTTQVFSNGETGITATKLNNIVGQAAIQTSFVSGQPLASSIGTSDQYLLLTSGGTYARVSQSTLLTSVSGSLTPAGVGQAGVMNALDGNSTSYVSGANTCVPLASAPALLTVVGQRAFNAVGNPTMEVDQRAAGASTTVTSTIKGWIDRWNLTASSATIGCSSQQIPANVAIPGSNYLITSKIFRSTVTVAVGSLAATDYMVITQFVEGPQLRELINDVHSVSIIARSNVANLKFGLTLQDSSAAYGLTKLCTLGTANTWTLISLPNLPIWTASGTFPLTPGSLGYYLYVTLAAGSNYTVAANDVWAATNKFGALGQSNFAATNGNTFDLAYVSHVPGPTAMVLDCSFGANLDGPMGCQRYFQKSYAYATALGTNTNVGAPYCVTPANAYPNYYIPFKKTMAKVPTISGWSATGAFNNVRDINAATDRAISAANGGGDSGFSGFNLSTLNAATTNYNFHYTADTGW